MLFFAEFLSRTQVAQHTLTKIHNTQSTIKGKIRVTRLGYYCQLGYFRKLYGILKDEEAQRINYNFV